MVIKPEDKPKIIGLVVALLGVFAYVLVFLVPKLTAGASPAPGAEPPPATAASVTNTAPAAGAAPPVAGVAANGGEAAALPDEDMAPIPSPPAHDSFTPPASMFHALAAVNPTPAPKPTVAPGLGPFIGPMGIVGGPNMPVQTQAPPPAPLPTIELKGVILGDPAVAVISVNGEVIQRQCGEVIAGTLKLVKIADVGITVLDGKRYLPVTVGHMMAGSGAPGQQPQNSTTLVSAAH